MQTRQLSLEEQPVDGPYILPTIVGAFPVEDLAFLAISGMLPASPLPGTHLSVLAMRTISIPDHLREFLFEAHTW